MRALVAASLKVGAAGAILLASGAAAKPSKPYYDTAAIAREFDAQCATGSFSGVVMIRARGHWNVGGLKPEDFELLTGEVVLATYARQTEAFEISHKFCAKCGTQTHGTGYLEELGGAFVSVRVAAIDDVTVDELVSAPVTYCDGLQNNWWNTPEEKRHL